MLVVTKISFLGNPEVDEKQLAMHGERRKEKKYVLTMAIHAGTHQFACRASRLGQKLKKCRTDEEN